tara:strand:+ start:693 stop:1382 length:690 start_codon:yes stop_codon:yes gene_type:complete
MARAKAIRGLIDALSNSHSATRLDESGKKVRMSKESNVPVMQEVASPKARKAAAAKQNTSAAKAKRKAEGKAASDLTQPAGGSVGKTAEQANAGMRPSRVAAKNANDFDKALASKEKELADMRAKADDMKDRINKIEYLANNKSKMDALKASIKDMKSRGGPGGRTKIKYKKDGGGVSKAMGEDRTRSPKGYDAASQAKKQTKKTVKKKHGGKVVSGNDGNSIVAGCYD